MSLERAIHERWADDAALNALLPVARLTTGRAVEPVRPYATILRAGSRPLVRTNAGDAVDEVTLRIHVWHDRYDPAQAILGQVRALFDRSRFALSGGQRVLDMRCTGDTVMQHDDGTWQLTVEFLVRLYFPSGV